MTEIVFDNFQKVWCGLGHFLNFEFLKNFLWSPPRPLVTLGMPVVPPLHLTEIFLNCFLSVKSDCFLMREMVFDNFQKGLGYFFKEKAAFGHAPPFILLFGSILNLNTFTGQGT